MPFPFDPRPPPRQPLGLPDLAKLLPSAPAAPPLTGPARRTVFISHSHLHELETKQFLKDSQGVFIPKSIGVSDRDDFIESTDPDYVMRRILQKHIGSASRTIILVGSCTHSRRYVDWEIKASLQQGKDRLPNDLLAIHFYWEGEFQFNADGRLGKQRFFVPLFFNAQRRLTQSRVQADKGPWDPVTVNFGF